MGGAAGTNFRTAARRTCRRAEREISAVEAAADLEITCVTETEQPQSETPTPACKDGEQRGGLLEWRKLDPLERLKEFRGFPRSGPKLKTSYTHDAFDRVSWQNEWPDGQAQARRTDFAHLGLGPQVVSEKQSRPQTTSKSYSLDPDGEAIGVTIGTTSYSFARNANDSVSLLLKETGGAHASYHGFRFDPGSGRKRPGNRRRAASSGRGSGSTRTAAHVPTHQAPQVKEAVKLAR